jgi:rhamnosyl/mannosyltransferase
MKILQIYKDYFPPVRGGIEGHINLLANGIRERGHDVEVLVSNRACRFEMTSVDGITITKVPQIARFAAAPINFSLFYWMKKIGSRFDILHFHHPNPTAEISFLLSGLKNKAVVTYHSDIVRQKWISVPLRPLLELFLRKVDRIIATSPNYLESSLILRKYKHKCQVVPLGIKLSRFNSRPAKPGNLELLRKKYGARLILFVGKFRYYKGLHVLIEAMKQVEGSLLLIGEGNWGKKLKSQVSANGLGRKVFFLGELSDREVDLLLKICDIFVLPSVRRSEAFGIVQLEAMACGKPVICTELGTGTTYVTQNQKTGIVVPPNDANELARAINFLLINPELGQKYGRAGLKRVKQYFSIDPVIDNIIGLYSIIFNS